MNCAALTTMFTHHLSAAVLLRSSIVVSPKPRKKYKWFAEFTQFGGWLTYVSRMGRHGSVRSHTDSSARPNESESFSKNGRTRRWFEREGRFSRKKKH